MSVTVTEAGDPKLYVEGGTPVNVAVTVPALWMTVSSVVSNAGSSMLGDNAGITTVTLLGRSSIRVGPVCSISTFSSSSCAGGGVAVTVKRTESPSTTESVSAVMVTEFAGGGGLMMTGPVMTGPVVEPPPVDDAVTVTEAEPAGPTVYPSPSVTDAVIVPPGLVGAVGTVSIAASNPAPIVIVIVAGSSSASSTPVFVYATCTAKSVVGAGEAFTVYDTGCPASTVSESARIVTVLSVLCWGAAGVTGAAVVGSGTSALGDAPLHPASASEMSEIKTNSPYGKYESAKREFSKRCLRVIIDTPNSCTTCPKARLTSIEH